MGILTHYFVYQCGIVAILYTVIFLDSGIYPQISGDMGVFQRIQLQPQVGEFTATSLGKGSPMRNDKVL